MNAENGEIDLDVDLTTNSFVYCPECNKILYETPIERRKINGIYLRVINSTIERHLAFLQGHNPEIFTRNKKDNEVFECWEENTYCIEPNSRIRRALSGQITTHIGLIWK